MIRNGRAASIGVPILHMRATLSREGEAKCLENASDLSRFENRRPGHELRRHDDALRADKLALQLRFAVLQKQFDDLAKIALKLVEGLALRVSAREAGNEADVKAVSAQRSMTAVNAFMGKTILGCTIRVNARLRRRSGRRFSNQAGQRLQGSRGV